MGICVHIEVQKGKLAMARKKFCRQFGATTACTVHLCHALNMSEHAEVPPLARCVFADSWFASIKTDGSNKNGNCQFSYQTNETHFGQNETRGTYYFEVC